MTLLTWFISKFCAHSYELLETKTYEVFDPDEDDSRPMYVKYALLQRCSKCGWHWITVKKV